jgi:hypothetical protein
MALSLVGCSYFSGTRTGEGYNPDYAVAVILTNRQTPSTFINYYDKDLNLVASLEYPYKMIQSPWGKPEVYDATVYLTPQGTALNPTSSVVAALDLATGKIKDLDADGGVSNVTANERYIFGAASGGMGRIDKETGKVVSIQQPGYLFPFAHEDKVYVFNDQRPEDFNHGWLFVMSEDLEVLETIDFGAESALPQTCGFIGDRLYFILVAKNLDNIPWEDLEWGLCYYSTEDSKVHTLTTVQGMRLEFVESIGSKLYVIATGDTTGDTLNKILIIDEKTGVIEGECKMGSFVPQYLLAKDNILYVGGTEGEDRTHELRSYVPDSLGLREVGSIPLTSYDTSTIRYYIGGLFAQN